MSTRRLLDTMQAELNYFSSALADQLFELTLPGRNNTGSSALISPEVFLELQIISQQIAGDLGLEVTIGDPGEGSFFEFHPPRVTLDPLHILENPTSAKFVAGHEGAHRRFSISPLELIPVASELEAVFGQLGFHATMNTIEDCAVNDGMCREVPGMARYTTDTYARADKEGLQIATPEITALIRQMGREPKFAQFLAELMRDWHHWRREGGYRTPFEKQAKEGRYGKEIDPSVVKALRNTRRVVRQAISSMPLPGERDYEIVKGFGLKRLEITRDHIYPEVERLIQEDIDLEAMRQALNERNEGASGSSQSLLEDKLSDSSKEEIENAVQDLLKETAVELYDEYQKLRQNLDEQQFLQKNLKKQLEDARIGGDEEKNASSTDEKGAGAEELTRALNASRLQEQALKEELEEKFPGMNPGAELSSPRSKEEISEKLRKKLEQELKENNEKPIPFGSLSKKTRHEIAQAFQKLSDSEKEQCRELAKQQLAQLEHEIVEALKPKLEDNAVETIHERRLREERDKKESENHSVLFNSHLEELSQLQDELERERQLTLEPFDRVFEEVAKEVQEATNRLQRILIPEGSLRWRRDQETGTRVNLGRALQSEADPRYLTKLFERRLTPIHRTHAFQIVVDTSESMENEKVQRTFDGVVFAASLCENLCVRFEIIEFNDTTTVRKKWEDSIKNDFVKERITQVSEAKKAGTNDAKALEKAYARLKDQEASYKFIFVLTDAQSGAGQELKKILAKIEKDHTTVVVHFGIGAGTADTHGYYRHSFSELSPSGFFKKFCEVVEDIILNPENYLSQQSEV